MEIYRKIEQGGFIVKTYYLGIDIGGTSSKIGIIEKKGTILEKWEIPSKINGQADQIPKKIWESIKIKLKKHSIDREQIFGIGSGAPGFNNAEKTRCSSANSENLHLVLLTLKKVKLHRRLI